MITRRFQRIVQKILLMPLKMGIRLLELKTDGSHKEFILKESVGENIVIWECLPDIGTIRKYLRKHKFPEDKCYCEKELIEDAAFAGGYVHLWVERQKTAEFIAELIGELI